MQLLSLRFRRPVFHGEICSELHRLGDNNLVRVIDVLGVRKGFAGEVELLHDS